MHPDRLTEFTARIEQMGDRVIGVLEGVNARLADFTAIEGHEIERDVLVDAEVEAAAERRSDAQTSSAAERPLATVTPIRPGVVVAARRASTPTWTQIAVTATVVVAGVLLVRHARTR